MTQQARRQEPYVTWTRNWTDGGMVKTVLERVGYLSEIQGSGPVRHRRRLQLQVWSATRADQIGSHCEVEPDYVLSSMLGRSKSGHWK